MKHNTFSKFSIFLLLLIIISGCADEPKKIGLLIHSLENERWSSDRDHIVERITELGGEAIVKTANNDQYTQNSQARQLLNQGIDVLIVIPVDQNQSSDIVSMAHEKEVEVIAYDRLIRESDLDYYVTTNSTRVGEIQAEYMTSLVPTGNYALINGDKKDNNSLLLFLGQMNVLQEKIEAGDIRVVYSEFTNNWDREEAYEHAQKVLALKDTSDVIFCGSDELAYGVNRALEEADLLGKVKIISQDADLEIVRNIAKGKQAATIYKPLKEMGYKAAEIAMKLAAEEVIKKDYTTTSNGKRLVPSYLLEPMLVNENTISSTVVKEGYHRSEEIFQ